MSKYINIGSTQINNGFSGQYYLPYSIGILQSYIKHNSKNPDKFKFQTTIYKRLLLNECVKAIARYCFNKHLCLEHKHFTSNWAGAKKINPNIFLIYGGPSVQIMYQVMQKNF